jgi:hypothetical protein
MPWSNGEQHDDYNEETALNEYISRNMGSLISEAEFRGLLLARKIEKSRNNPEYLKMYQELMAAEPLDVIKFVDQFVKNGSESTYNRLKNQAFSGALPINRCPKCNRVVRTPLAQLCLWCGHDWHE